MWLRRLVEDFLPLEQTLVLRMLRLLPSCFDPHLLASVYTPHRVLASYFFWRAHLAALMVHHVVPEQIRVARFLVGNDGSAEALGGLSTRQSKACV